MAVLVLVGVVDDKYLFRMLSVEELEATDILGVEDIVPRCAVSPLRDTGGGPSASLSLSLGRGLGRGLGSVTISADFIWCLLAALPIPSFS